MHEVMKLISKALEASSGFCQAFFCSVQVFDCYRPGWSCFPTVLHSGCRPVLVNETGPGHGVRQGIATFVLSHC